MGALSIFFLSLLLSFKAHAVEFPEITGHLHNLSGWDLSALKLSAAVDCVDPITGPCGSLSKTGSWNNEKSTFALPAFSLNAEDESPPRQGYTKPAWGKRYTYHVHIEKIGGTDIAHNLMWIGWENRPESSLKELLKELANGLPDLTLYAVTSPTKLLLSPASAMAGRTMKLRLQKYFSPTDKSLPPEIARLWWHLDLPAAVEGAEDLTVTLAPTGFVVRGAPKQYGDQPATRTVLHVYRLRPGIKKKFDFMGFADEVGEFSKDGIFGAKGVKITSGKP